VRVIRLECKGRRVDAPERPNVADVTRIIGNVKDRDVLIVDDIVDTAGTLSQGARALLDAGARRVFASCTHAVLSGSAVERIESSPMEELAVTDTIPLSKEATGSSRIKVLTVGQLLAEAIRRIHEDASVSSLFV